MSTTSPFRSLAIAGFGVVAGLFFAGVYAAETIDVMAYFRSVGAARVLELPGKHSGSTRDPLSPAR